MFCNFAISNIQQMKAQQATKTQLIQEKLSARLRAKNRNPLKRTGSSPCDRKRKRPNIEVGSHKMVNLDWIRCPICGNKTRNRVRQDTILIKYPLFCPKCKQETLVNLKKFDISVIKEPDA